MAQEMEAKALDWDDDVEDSGGFTLLEPGLYPFTVAGFERERFAGSAKLPPCPRAALELEMEYPGGSATVRDGLLLTTKTQWRVARFFECLGFPRGEDGKVRVDWSAIVGRSGWAKVGVRAWTDREGNERQSNEVEEYLRPDRFAEAFEAHSRQFGGDAQARSGASYTL